MRWFNPWRSSPRQHWGPHRWSESELAYGILGVTETQRCKVKGCRRYRDRRAAGWSATTDRWTRWNEQTDYGAD